VVSSVLIGRITEGFVRRIEAFVANDKIPVVQFRKGERKPDLTLAHLARFKSKEGVLFVGKAQKRVSVFRTEKRRDAQGLTYPWIVRGPAMVNQ
jgi:hypothetical protein